MAVGIQRITVTQFDRFVARPENADRSFEYIGGKVVEGVSNHNCSAVAMLVGARLLVFVQENGLGYVTGADGGYQVSGERYIPDVAFISKARQLAPSHDAYNPVPPDLAVEVVSPANDPGDVRLKVVNYLAAGTVVWLVLPDPKVVEVYAPGQPARRLALEDVLDGGGLLPGFSLAVADIFPEEAESESA
jgi:Uma2 family endonuclease